MKNATKNEQLLNEIVQKAMNEKPDGGSIDLDTLQKEFKDLTRHELVQLAKNNSLVKTIFGRKGAKTRIAYGNAVPANFGNVQSHSSRKTNENKFIARLKIGDSIVVDYPVQIEALIPVTA